MAAKFWRKSDGYTLIELTVVLAVIALIGVISFFGLRTNDNQNALDNSAKNMLTQLRTAQNQVLSGSGQIATRTAQFVNNATSYTVDGVNYSLPAGAALSITQGGGNVWVCFENINLTGFQPGGPNNNCPCTNSFACTNSGSSLSSSSPIQVTIQGFGLSKSVWIEGSGLFVQRIYGQ